MSRPGKAKPRTSRSGRRPGIEILEGRSLPAGSAGINFLSALGIGVTGRNSAIHSNAVATDAADDTYITGSFRGTASFDPNSSTATITTANTQDTFVAKYGPTGGLIWAKTFAGKATTTTGGFTTYAVGQGSAIAVDGSGNVFVSGGFSGTVDLTNGSKTTEISSPSGTEPYVAKLDASGNAVWVDAIAGTAYDTDNASALALDGSGGAVIAGSFSDSATFGPTILNSGGLSEAFAARVDSNGNFLWAVASRGTPGSNAVIEGVAVDPSGNVDLAGFFSNTVDFDPSSATANLASAGSFDAVLWKLDSNGHFLWARSYGSGDSDAANALAVDASGNIYVAGMFSDNVNFGTVSSPDSLTSGTSTFDAFVLKLDPNGNEVWVKGLVGPGGWAKGQGIAVDPLGNIHIAGTFQGTVDFDPGPGLDNLTSGGNTDAFVAGLDQTGNLVYALHAGQANSNTASGVAVNASGTVSITGTYTTAIAFGSTNLAAQGVASVFIARVMTQTPAPVAPSAPQLEASSDTGVSQTDRITSATAPVFDVNTADPSNTVELLRNGVIVGQRTGPGAIKDPGPLGNGTYLYTAIQVSAAGVSGPVSSPGTSVTILATPPAAPNKPALLPADDSGPAGGALTNVRQPRIQGTAPAGMTVRLINLSGTVLATTTAASDGSYTAMIASPLADGSVTIDAVAVDVAGNVSQTSLPLTLTIDTTPPGAPTILALVTSDDSGTLGDNTTNVRTPRLSGKTEAGATVKVVDTSGTVYATTVAASDGTFTATVSSPLADGTYTLEARATDLAGNLGPVGPTMSLKILATPPSAPSAPTLLAADDSGTTGDGITNLRQPRLTGSAVPGLAVRLLNSANAVLATATAAIPGGSFTVSPSAPLTDGTYALRFVAVDAAGNASATGGTITLTILATPPPRPAPPTLLAADDTGALGDGLTSVDRPRLVGVAIPGGRVDWLAANGSILASAVATAGGSYLLQPASALVNGSYPVRVRQTDAAGNVSPISTTFNLTIRVAPGDDYGNSRSDFAAYQPSTTTFSVQNPTTLAVMTRSFGIAGDIPVGGDFFGNGHNDIAVYRPGNSTFYVLDPVTNATITQPFGQPGDVPEPADFDGDGKADFAVFRPGNSTWYVLMSATNTVFSEQFAIPGDVPVPGDYFGFGHADYAVYRPSTATYFVYDPITTGFAMLAVGSPGSTPVPADYEGLGHLDLAVFEPWDQTYVILYSTGTVSRRVWGIPGDVPVSGDYTGDGRADLTVFRPSTATFFTYDLTNGAVQVQQLGTPGAANPVSKLLTTPPSAPSAPTLLAADDSGTTGDGITDARQPRLTGSAVPGLAVRLLNSANAVLATATAAIPGGSFTLAPSAPLADGTYALRFVAVDAAGNASAAGATTSLTILATPPPRPAPPTLLAADDTGALGDGLTSVDRPRLVGVAIPGGRVDWLAANGSILASAVATAGGSYLLQPASALVNGSYPVRVRQTDAAGNVSPISTTFNLTIRVAPGDDYGNSRSDFAAYQPSTTTFSVQNPTTLAVMTRSFGIAGDIPVGGDFFGNGHNDIAVYRPGNSTFYVLDPVTNATITQPFGQPGDVPEPADFDGDGKADFAVFRPGNSTWYVLMSATNTVFSEQFAIPGDVPVPGDYFGFGHADYAVYRPSTATYFVYDPITTGFAMLAVGSPGSTPVPADYEGLGHLDLAVFEPWDQTYVILYSTGTVSRRVWGIPGDVPVSGDYTGDGRADLTVFRPSTATFFTYDLTNGAVQVQQLGTPGAVRPVLAPITTWYSFGGTVAAPAVARSIGPSNAASLTYSLLPDPSPSTSVAIAPPRKAAMVDRAVDALGLEYWRPGS